MKKVLSILALVSLVSFNVIAGENDASCEAKNDGSRGNVKAEQSKEKADTSAEGSGASGT